MLLLCYIQNFFKSVNFESRQQGCVPLLTACFRIKLSWHSWVIVEFVGYRGIIDN